MECAMKKLVYKFTMVLSLPHSWISLNTHLLTDAEKLFISLNESLMPMEEATLVTKKLLMVLRCACLRLTMSLSHNTESEPMGCVWPAIAPIIFFFIDNNVFTFQLLSEHTFSPLCPCEDSSSVLAKAC